MKYATCIKAANIKGADLQTDLCLCCVYTAKPAYTGPHSAVGNVSGNRCESDCRSRGRELNLGPVPYFLWDRLWIIRSFSSLLLNNSRRIVVSYKRKYVHEVLVNCLFKLAQEKSVVRWTDRPSMTIAVDLGRKTKNKQKKLHTTK